MPTYMQKATLCVLVIMLLLVPSGDSIAGFVRKKQATENVVKQPTSSFNKANMRHAELVSRLFAKQAINNDEERKYKPRNSGWEGIVAFACGVTGLFIPAIIFGAIGMAKGKRNREWAIAGFVLGLIGFLISVLILLFFLAYFGIV
jgi:hypothetical protein